MNSLSGAAAIAALVAAAAPAGAVAAFDVTFESEAPGMQTSSATFYFKGVETFDSRPTGTGKTFVTDYGSNGQFSGTYRNVQINGADQYGGAGGTGRYAVTFTKQGYSLELASTVGSRRVNYFGYWLSALDKGNQVSFYRSGKLLFTFDPTDVMNAIKKTPNPRAYFGNPNSPFAGNNSTEPYAFVNFFSQRGGFDRVVFREDPQGGGYESDNHTVGSWKTMGTGTKVTLTNSALISPAPSLPGAVPEPSTWAMLIAGFGLVGLGARRRRAAVA